MAKATITLEDAETSQVTVRMDFGDGGLQGDSGAHHMAVDMLGIVTEQLEAASQITE